MHINLPTALTFLFASASPTISHGFSSMTALPLRRKISSVRVGHGKLATSSLFAYFDDEDQHDFYNDNHNNLDLNKVREKLEAQVSAMGSTQELQSDFYHEMKVRDTSRQVTATVQPPTYQPADPLFPPTLDNVAPLPPATPLTTIERERREVELSLLKRLASGDDAVADLLKLWQGERGMEAAQKLLLAEELTNDGNWDRAEKILRGLIEEHGVYWVEPLNRLSTLYYMQGRLDEAETLIKVVLSIKPWHVGALSGIVMIYAAQADSEKARRWAASRLPTLAPSGANRRRKAWAEQAVLSAQESLANAEKRIQDLFGAPDDYSDWRRVSDRNFGDDASWQ